MPKQPMSLRRRLIRIALILLLFPPILAAVAGWIIGPSFLHPIRRELTASDIRDADVTFQFIHAQRQDFTVRAPDGVLLRGWLVHPANPNGSWVLLFHGVADNRMGVIGQADLLLRAGYSVVMMDARAHGASDGPIATYGWLERNDTKSIIDALFASFGGNTAPVGAGPLHIEPRSAPPVDPPSQKQQPASVSALKATAASASESSTSLTSSTSSTSSLHLFALGESMGAGIALQSAAVDPRIEGVVAEASFASLREASYDYAGLRKSPLLGKTLLAPFSWTLVYRGESLAGFPASGVSPEAAVAARPFPVLIICDADDVALPCRHSERIYGAAAGPKQFWKVPGAFHSAALGYHPDEFRRRVLAFFAQSAATSGVRNAVSPTAPASRGTPSTGPQ